MKAIVILAALLFIKDLAIAQPKEQTQVSKMDEKSNLDSSNRVFRIKMNAILNATIPEENGDRIFQPKMIDTVTKEVTPVGPSIRYHLFDPNDIFHIGGGQVGDYVPITREDEFREAEFREVSHW